MTTKRDSMKIGRRKGKKRPNKQQLLDEPVSKRDSSKAARRLYGCGKSPDDGINTRR